MTKRDFITDKFHGKPNNNSIIGSRFPNVASSFSMSYIKYKYSLEETSQAETAK